MDWFSKWGLQRITGNTGINLLNVVKLPLLLSYGILQRDVVFVGL